MSAKRQELRRRSKINHRNEEWPDEMKASIACKFLGVSKAKMTSLLGAGVLPFKRDYLDYRVKIIKRSDLETLLQKHRQV
jgi:hypothetical protein